MDPTERIQTLERLLVHAVIYGDTGEATRFCLEEIDLAPIEAPAVIDFDGFDRDSLETLFADYPEKGLAILGAWLESPDLVERDKAVGNAESLLFQVSMDKAVKAKLVELLVVAAERETVDWYKDTILEIISEHT